MPGSVADADLSLPADLIRATEKAIADLVLMEHQIPAAADAIGRMLLRSEGIASSAVEGLRVPLEEVLSVEAVGQGAPDASWVAGNLSVVTDALGDATQPMTVDTLHRWHRRLMEFSPLDRRLIGAWRDSPGWIGGSSPLDAVYVPPPANEIEGLMADLVEYLNGNSDDPITQAAVAHAQFETIHPYGDGNGRIGRVLIGWVLRRREVVHRWPPPISISIARDSGGYLGGLFQYRKGDPMEWLRWFAGVTSRSAGTAADLYSEINQVEVEWEAALVGVRSDAAARSVVSMLTAQPVLSADHVMARLGVSRRTAITSLELLEERSILSPITIAGEGAGRPRRWWIADQLVDLVRTFVG